jgi:hypothetical protein
MGKEQGILNAAREPGISQLQDNRNPDRRTGRSPRTLALSNHQNGLDCFDCMETKLAHAPHPNDVPFDCCLIWSLHILALLSLEDHIESQFYNRIRQHKLPEGSNLF